MKLSVLFGVGIINKKTNILIILQKSYVHEINGLFPMAYPAPVSFGDDGKYVTHYQSVLDLFNFMGIFLAKSLQDQRLVDIPFSYPFLKLLCGFQEKEKRQFESESQELEAKFDFSDILTLDDLELIDPCRGRLLKQLKLALELQRSKRVEEFLIETNGNKMSLEDLG